MPNRTLYELMTDGSFIRFNDWLQKRGLDFQELSDIQLRMNITMYANDIQRELINWMEEYKNAD